MFNSYSQTLRTSIIVAIGTVPRIMVNVTNHYCVNVNVRVAALAAQPTSRHSDTFEFVDVL